MKTLITTSVIALALSTSFAAASSSDALGVIAPSMDATISAPSEGAGLGQTSQGKSQLAAQLGLKATDYTAAELIRIQRALENNNITEANYVINHTNRVPVNVAPQPVLGSQA